MDRVRERIHILEKIFRVGIFLEENVGTLSVPGLVERLRSGKSNGWTDSSGNIHLLRRNLRDDDRYVDSAVLYQAVSSRGLEGLLGPKMYGLLCMDLASSRDFPFVGGVSASSLKDAGAEFLTSLSGSRSPAWDLVACAVARLLGLPESPALSSALCAGEASYRRRLFRKAEVSGDVDVLQGALVSSLSSGRPSGTVSFGVMSEPYQRLGYPALPMLESAGHLSAFMSRNRLSGEFVDSLVEKVRNPLAVYRGRRGPEGARDNRWVAVTDVEVERGVRLALVLDSPSDVRAASKAGSVASVNFRGLALVDEPTLLNDLGHSDDGVSQIRYLRACDGADGRSYDVSRILKRMEGRELFRRKESAAGTPLVASPMDISRRLEYVANIVENFRNPMSQDKFLRLFGRSREDYGRERTIGGVEPPPAARPAVPASVPRQDRTFRERLSTPLAVSGLGASVLRKLSDAGLRNAGDVISYGSDRMLKDFGRRTFNSVSRFLESQGLSFSNGRRYASVSEDSFMRMSAQEKDNVRFSDLVNALSCVPDRIEPGSLRMPCDSSGVYFSGVDAASLVARMSGVGRWKGCNVFLDRDELDRLGLSLGVAALPCYVTSFDGQVKPCYNLADTSVVSDREVFEAVKNASLAGSAPVPAYLTGLLPNVKVTSVDDARGLYGWLDSSCRRNFHTADFRMRPEPVSSFLGRLSSLSCSCGVGIGVTDNERDCRKGSSLKI